MHNLGLSRAVTSHLDSQWELWFLGWKLEVTKKWSAIGEADKTTKSLLPHLDRKDSIVPNWTSILV